MKKQKEQLPAESTSKEEVPPRGKWIRIGLLTVLAIILLGGAYSLGKNKAVVTTETPTQGAPTEIIASEDKRNFYTKSFSLEYPSNWFVYEYRDGQTNFELSDVQNSPFKIPSGNSKKHVRIYFSSASGQMPRCYSTTSNGTCTKTENEPYSINGYQGYRGQSVFPAGNTDIVYLRNPYDNSKYISLTLIKPQDNPQLSEKVFEDVLSSISFINQNTQVPTAAVDSSGARLDLFTKNIGVKMNNARLSVNGIDYLKTIENFSLYSQPLTKVEGEFSNTTIETSWTENKVEMRMYFYFRYKEGQNWELYDLATYNGQRDGEWLYYSPVDSSGKRIQSDASGKFQANNLNLSSRSGSTQGKLYFGSLEISAIGQ